MKGLYDPDDKHNIDSATAIKAAAYDRPLSHLLSLKTFITGIENNIPEASAVILRGLRSFMNIIVESVPLSAPNILNTKIPKSDIESHLNITKPISTTSTR